jgi:hypothetical protein
MKTKLIAAALLLIPLHSATSAPLVSNLENVTFGNNPVLVQPDRNAAFPDYTRRAQSFTTGNDSREFGAVTLSMNDAIGGDGFHVDLHADAAGVPSETPLMSLIGNNNPSVTGLYDYFRSFPLTLLPNTRYWVVAAADVVLPYEEFACMVRRTKLNRVSLAGALETLACGGTCAARLIPVGL